MEHLVRGEDWRHQQVKPRSVYRLDCRRRSFLDIFTERLWWASLVSGRVECRVSRDAQLFVFYLQKIFSPTPLTPCWVSSFPQRWCGTARRDVVITSPYNRHRRRPALNPGCTSRLLQILALPETKVDARDPDTGWTALHFAARQGKLEAVDLLLRGKASVVARAPEGRTPLHFAAGWGTYKVIPVRPYGLECSTP